MNLQEIPSVPDTLTSLVQSVKENYLGQPPPSRRGPKATFSDLSWLLLAVVGVTLRTFNDSELHRLLSKDAALRATLGFCRVPHRTWIGRRLNSLVAAAEAQIAALGQVLVAEVKPAAEECAASAIDGRMYEALGPRWHKADREAQRIPPGLRNVDTESTWSKSGYRQWVQGYRLVLQGLVFPLPVPLWAAWRPNHQNEAVIASAALAAQTLIVTDVLLGDTTFGQPDFTLAYAQAGGWALTPKALPAKPARSWKNDWYEYRKETIELLFQRIIQAADLKECQVKGAGRNGAFVLASVWLYQICFLKDYRDGKPLAHIKEHLEEARWRLRE